MQALVLCFFAFCAAFLAGRRSLVNGLLAALAVGYVYGIVRANVLSPFSHFTFDAALAGLYLSRMFAPKNPARGRAGTLRVWITLLIGWPFLLLFLPFQPLLVSAVGLRGNVFFLPVCLLATRLTGRDTARLCQGLAALNVVALCFGIAEYVSGIEKFFPISPVTAIIYASHDVAGYNYYRIPATFVTAHAYAGTMVTTLPFLIGAWSQTAAGKVFRIFMLCGIVAAAAGILLANTKMNVVIGVLIAVAALVRGRLTFRTRIVWCCVMFAAAFLAVSNERLQRFTDLSDSNYVSERIHGSVNRTFLEILQQYPMGNGLGGGGTSMPSFLAGDVRNPVAMESEYARILLEQGLVGLLLWLLFIGWFFTCSAAKAPGEWQTARRLAWLCCAAYLVAGMIGTGMLTSIPQTMLMLLGFGWVMVKPAPEPAAAARPESPLSLGSAVHAW